MDKRDSLNELISQCEDYLRGRGSSYRFGDFVAKCASSVEIEDSELAQIARVETAMVTRWRKGKQEPSAPVKARVIRCIRSRAIIALESMEVPSVS
jgi:hypothetical protein